MKYDERGVSASKTDVHNAIKNLDKGLFPKAFCKVVGDLDPNYCNVMHADGAGTKSSLAYLWWKETGDISVWKGIAQDAIVMNTDDLLCVGVTDNILLSSTIGRNKHLIPGEVISTIIEGTVEFIEKMKKWGINIILTGGETADVGDLVKTIIVDSNVLARVKKETIIDNSNIKPGDVIIGLASYGKSIYETKYNSGIGSNGLTSARHDVLNKAYSSWYPETYDSYTKKEFVYSGRKYLQDKFENYTVGELLLSPTRTYAPVIKRILDEFGHSIHGMIHCTGGGQHKVLNFVDDIHVVKNNLFDIPPVFRMIMNESDSPLDTIMDEMYNVFNMGHRFEIYVPQNVASDIISIINEFEISSRIIGYCEPHKGNKLTLVF